MTEIYVGKGDFDLKAYEWAGMAKKLDRMISAKISERDKIRALAVSTVGSLDGMPRSEGERDRVGNLAVKLISAEEELDELIDEYINCKNEITELFEKLPARYYGVLHRYYIRGMTVEAIADELHYSARQVARIKRAAIRELEFLLEERN